jgi:glycine betaine/proline transport system permease protein
MGQLPVLPLESWVTHLVETVLQRDAAGFDAVANLTQELIEGLQQSLLALPPPVFILLTAWLARATAVGRAAGWGLAAFALAGLGLVWNLGLWQALIESLTLVLAAELLVLAIGLPLGIGSAHSRLLERALRPVLDLMQTMPAFVYLVPAVVFFGLGLVPGVFATTIFALPPLVRLTALGIRQVPHELVEATRSFGGTGWQLLTKVLLPCARPSIMAGVNQSIMLALSMVVIAAMIGAGGIGSVVLTGITRLDIGKAFTGGICVVVLAVLLDRLTQAFARPRQGGKKR